MFPSSGLLTDFKCYLFERELCKRPHCVFKHGTELELTKEDTNESFQELERINREIESVKHEVEEQQRRLTNYQIKSTPETINYCDNSEVVGRNVNKDLSETCTRPKKKYTVDSSKPRTDLEYDPLSNFSSDLRSYCSSKNESKSRRENGLERDPSTINQRMPKVKVPQTQKLSLEHLDSNEDDDVLIIDLPHSPTKREEEKTVGGAPSCDRVSSLATSNSNGSNAFVKKNQSGVNLSTPKSNLTNNFIPNNENIFEKMTQHLSNLNSTQPCESQSDVVFDNNSSANALPVSETLTKQTQKPEAPGQSMISADAQRKVKELQQRVFVGSLCEPCDILSAAKWTQNASLLSEMFNQQMHSRKADIIVIDSSSDELNYSDIEVSESDPEEECYRIFMEANREEDSNEPAPDEVSDCAEADKLTDLQPQALLVQERVTRENKVLEVVGNSGPQTQTPVPLQTPVSSPLPSQLPGPLMVHKVEQRVSMLTASVKAGQSLVAKGHSETKTANITCYNPTKPAPCISYIPLGAAVIDVGNNLHLILPEGTFPVSDTSGQVSSVLTPITPVNTNSITMKQGCPHPSTTTQQRHTSQSMVIPPPARKPVSATNANLCSTAQSSIVKSVGNKRKLKQQSETVKVPHDVRQSYVNKFTEEFLKTTTNINEAFRKALVEERTVYNRSANKLKYLSVAVNALKRLRNQTCGNVKESHYTSQKTKGNIPLNPSLLNEEGVLQVYECLKDYILSDGMMIESNFPLQNPEKPGSAILFGDKKNVSDPLRKLCCRCGATYCVSRTGKHMRKEECTYHFGRGVENKVPGGVETRYSCCEGVMGSSGCQVFKLHVSNCLNMDGFVSSTPRDPTDTSCPGVYSLDCEKCYTICGLELLRVTVVNSSLQIVYDTFVRPNNEVVDYNTRFSGICEEDLKGPCHSLREVQENLLSFIRADTILVGHGLETNLCVLKLIHGMVVDTSMVFPHRLGPPHKMSLQSLTAEYLRKIIQESVCDHDTAEDAVACMELMLWKAKEDGKLKKAP